MRLRAILIVVTMLPASRTGGQTPDSSGSNPPLSLREKGGSRKTLPPDRSAERGYWPSFRGPGAAGIGDGFNPPVSWDVPGGVNVRWRIDVPGLAHSSPVIWGNRVYVTSAVNRVTDAYLRVGYYSECPDYPEEVAHEFRVFAFDLDTGSLVWEQTACRGVPKARRHTKSSHANPTPATDGTHVVAFFGSEGLYCYGADGKELWKRDLGRLDAGAFDAPQFQWGFGSSPIIYRDLVIVQCDVNGQSFLAAFHVADGQQAWRVPRQVLPGWATPTVIERPQGAELVVNGNPEVRGHDPLSGALLWRLRVSALIAVPPPFLWRDLIIVGSSGRDVVKPIYAIRAGARGDISLAGEESANHFVAWSHRTRGSYVPTPIGYGEHLYVCNDHGILTCFGARTGEQVYHVRVGKGAVTFSASPVAADGHIYFTNEDGDVSVVRAGAQYALLASNPLGDVCLATPALAPGMIVFRTQHHLIGIGESR